MELHSFEIMADRKYRNVNKFAPQWSEQGISCLIIMPRGGGKTSIVLNLLTLGYIPYDRAYIYGKTLNQPKYLYLKEYFKELEESIYEETDKKIQVGYFSEDIDNIDLKQLDPKKNNIMIFDDVLNEANQTEIEKVFCNARHYNTQIYYLAQEYFKVPKIIRVNTNFVILGKINSANQLRAIALDQAGDIEYDTFMKYYRSATSGSFNYFIIDKVTNHRYLKYRRNFDEILTEES